MITRRFFLKALGVAGATVAEPLSMAGTTAQFDRTTAESLVDAWLR